MNIIALSLAVAIVATTATVYGASGELKVHDTDRRAPLEGRKALDIRNVTGAISLTQADGTTVAIHAHATSRVSDPALAQLDVQTDGDHLVVCVRYRHRACENGHEDDNDADNERDVPENHINVDLTIAVPRDIDVSAETVRGPVSSSKLADRLTASVVDGPIRIASLGSVHAQTVNGPIEATVSLGAGDAGNFQTVNGPVHIIFGSGANAAISAKTLAGRLTGDGVTFEHGDDAFVGQDATAKLGNGDARVSIQTVAGSIRVSKI